MAEMPYYIRKATKKFFILVARQLNGGGRAWPLWKTNFFWSSKKKFPKKNVATKLEGGGGKASVAGPLEFFLWVSLTGWILYFQYFTYKWISTTFPVHKDYASIYTTTIKLILS